MKIYKVISLILVLTFSLAQINAPSLAETRDGGILRLGDETVTHPGGVQRFLRPMAAGEKNAKIRPVTIQINSQGELWCQVFTDTTIEFNLPMAYRDTLVGLLPRDGVNWQSGFDVYYEGLKIATCDEKYHLRLTTYIPIARHYGELLADCYEPKLEKASRLIAALRQKIADPHEFLKLANKLKTVLRADDKENSMLGEVFGESRKAREIFGDEFFKPFLNTLEYLFRALYGNVDNTLWNAALEMLNSQGGTEEYRALLVTIASEALAELKESISTLKAIDSIRLTATGYLDLRNPHIRSDEIDPEIIVEPCPLLGNPIELWTYNGFSVFHIPYSHQYEYALLSLLRLKYGFYFDEFCLDYHDDNGSAFIPNVPYSEKPDFKNCDTHTWDLIKLWGEKMDCKGWRPYLYRDGTLLRTLLLAYENLPHPHFRFNRYKITGSSMLFGEVMDKLMPQDIKELRNKKGNIKRVLVVENDFVLDSTPQEVAQFIREKTEELKLQGLRFDAIILVDTNNTQHWRHNYHGPISYLYPVRRTINQIWIKELVRVYSNDKRSQELIALLRSDIEVKKKRGVFQKGGNASRHSNLAYENI